MRTCCGDLLIWLLSAACLAVDVKTPDYPVNASLHHQAWLPVQVGPLPQGAEVSWSFQSNVSSTLIARYDSDTKKVKYFSGKQRERRFMMLDNFTLWINSVKWEDAGSYTVKVITPTEWKAETSLRVYEPVSNVTVEVLNISSGQSCNVTLLCSATAGNKLSFSWSPRNGTALGQVSDHGADLSLSLAFSDRIDFTCTVWNPVSQGTANYSSEHACQLEGMKAWTVQYGEQAEAQGAKLLMNPKERQRLMQFGSSNGTGVDTFKIPMLFIVILCLVCVILCITFAIYIFCRKCKSISISDRSQESRRDGSRVFNDYVNIGPEDKIETVYCYVQRGS